MGVEWIVLFVFIVLVAVGLLHTRAEMNQIRHAAEFALDVATNAKLDAEALAVLVTDRLHKDVP